MTQIRSTRNGKTARVSLRLAKLLVSGGKYEYLTRDMQPGPQAVPHIQPNVVPSKPKRQYRRRAAQQPGEEE